MGGGWKWALGCGSSLLPWVVLRFSLFPCGEGRGENDRINHFTAGIPCVRHVLLCCICVSPTFDCGPLRIYVGTPPKQCLGHSGCLKVGLLNQRTKGNLVQLLIVSVTIIKTQEKCKDENAAPVSTTMVRKTTSPLICRPLFKAGGAFLFIPRQGCSPTSFFDLIFLGLLVYCLFIVMVTLENMGVGG